MNDADIKISEKLDDHLKKLENKLDNKKLNEIPEIVIKLGKKSLHIKKFNIKNTFEIPQQEKQEKKWHKYIERPKTPQFVIIDEEVGRGYQLTKKIIKISEIQSVHVFSPEKDVLDVNTDFFQDIKIENQPKIYKKMEKELEKINKKQDKEIWTNYSGCGKIIVVDNASSKDIITDKPKIERYFMNNRYRSIVVIFNDKTVPPLEVILRIEIDYVILFPTKCAKTLEKYYDNYGLIFDTFEEFKFFFEYFVLNELCLIIDFTKGRTLIENQIFYLD